MDKSTCHLQEQNAKLTCLVGNRLREERERLEITQADAALLTGVSRQMWGLYEKGAIPSSEVLLRAQGHGFDVNYILGGSRLMLAEGTLSAEEKELLTHFRALDKPSKMVVLRLAASEAAAVQPTVIKVRKQSRSKLLGDK